MNLGDSIKDNHTANATTSKLEGIIKIIVNNQATGKHEVVEGHNLITSAVSDIFNYNFSNLVDYSNYLPLYSKLFGGILCFRGDVLSTDPDEYAIPTTSAAYGNDTFVCLYGGKQNYASPWDSYMRMYYLDSEVVSSEHSITQVWESGSLPSWFSSETITSIGLCMAATGDSGGVLDLQQSDLEFHFPIDFVSRSITAASYGIDYGIDNAIFAIDNNMAYSFTVTADGILTLYKSNIEFNRFSLNNNLDDLLELPHTDEITIDLGHRFIADNSCMFHFDIPNSKLLLFSVYTTDDITDLRPKDLTVDTIDLTTYTCTSNTSTIAIGQYLWTLRTNVTGSGYTSYLNPLQAVVIDNMLYFPACTGRNKPEPSMYVGISLPDMEFHFTRSVRNISTIVSGAVLSYGNWAIQDSGVIFQKDGDIYYFTPRDRYGAQITLVKDITSARYYSGGIIGIHSSINPPTPYGNIEVLLNHYFLSTKYNLTTPIPVETGDIVRVEYTLKDT